ncbi:MAG: DUF4926 domain-containing protein [Alphaproteobacteria bacterium]|nr:DUF4926 domain-containing protein [Alphaproteobacteria bacterium]
MSPAALGLVCPAEAGYRDSAAGQNHKSKPGMKIDDVVTLDVDLPEHSLARGKHGFIVAIHDAPEPYCTVEFLDRTGNTLAQVPLRPGQFRILWSA